MQMFIFFSIIGETMISDVSLFQPESARLSITIGTELAEWHKVGKRMAFVYCW